MSFLNTAIKALGKDHFKKLLDINIKGLKTHPNLIRGFDMVDYEDSVYLKEFFEDLY